MADALSRYRQAPPGNDALQRYRQEPSGDTLGALAKYLGLQGYWDRQGQIAQEGLDMAEQGAQTVRGGDPRGFAGMFLGPAGYLASPITALLPTEAETYAARDLPEWFKPGAAAGIGTMMAVMPGPKVKGLGRGLDALAEGATDAERAALAARLEGEAAQNLPPFTAYHGSPVEGLSALKPSERGPFGPASYLSPVKDVAGRYGSNVYEVSVNPNEIFNGLGSRYFDGDVNGYELWRNQVARVAKASGAKADEVAAVLGKLDPQDGYRAYHDLRRIMGSDAEAQAVLQRAGFKGMSGHVDGPEVAMFGDVNLGTVATPRDQALRNLTEAPEGITAYHGSPHTFDKFDMSKIGTGEGAQAYGHGLYFAENEAVAKGYREVLSPGHKVFVGGDEVNWRHADQPWAGAYQKLSDHGSFDEARKFAKIERDNVAAWGRDTSRYDQTLKALDDLEAQGVKTGDKSGSMYQVRINAKPEEFLDWDRPLSEQAGPVSEKLKTILKDRDRAPADWIKSSPGAEQRMREAGIKGIRYKDAGSRSGEGGTYNYVVFDDSIIDILKRYGVPMTAGVGGAMVVSGQNMPEDLASQMGPQG